MAMSWIRILLIVIACAMVGMLLGGAFGFAAGSFAPELFENMGNRLLMDGGAAKRGMVIGASGGVFLGGGLGCFVLALQAVFEAIRRPRARA